MVSKALFASMRILYHADDRLIGANFGSFKSECGRKFLSRRTCLNPKHDKDILTQEFFDNFEIQRKIRALNAWESLMNASIAALQRPGG
jgi:hypothetical protein